MNTTVIYWFRQDLRTRDLAGLAAAAERGDRVIPCYVLDTATPGQWAPGGASRWWLHHSLTALDESLRSLGSRLLIRSGAAEDVITSLVAEVDAQAVYCSRCHEPWAAELEERLHETLTPSGVDFRRYPGALLLEPEGVSTKAGAPYKVFTPFWRAAREVLSPSQPLPPPTSLPPVDASLAGIAIDELQLLPRKPDWANGWNEHWQPGEAGALRTSEAFFTSRIGDYARGRDFPGRDSTSKLSPHLHLGEMSPRMLWHAARQHADRQPDDSDQVEKFLTELGWREFSAHLLHHFPTIPESNFKDSFDNFPWLGQDRHLTAWQQGQTGYPLVDAGMRELWSTGYMHNRVRMVVGSFLVKHLLISWQRGEEWFWDTLVDADLANNACGWQWIAGSGADAAPYFRIFNPTTQSQRFDPKAVYIRRWVPELAKLPDKHIHQPEQAPADVLADAGVTIGKTYPEPIVIHAEARRAALDAWETVRSGN